MTQGLLPAARSAAPLVLACLLLPLAQGGLALLGKPWPPALAGAVRWAWFGLAGLGALLALLERRKNPAQALGAGLLLGLVLAALFLFAAPALRAIQGLRLQIQELTPPAFLLLGWLWARTFGPPGRRAFLVCGGLLGLLCLLDLSLALFLQDRLVPSARLGGTGVQACLLLVCLCAGLRSGDEPRVPGALPWLAAMILGLAACFSALGLFAAGWVLLFFGPGRPGPRLTLAGLCLLLAAGAVLLPPGSPALRLEITRQWLAVWRALDLAPGAWLTGLPLKRPLALDVPPGLLPLLQASGRAPALLPGQVQAFWPRLVASWGLLAPLLFLAALALPALRRPTAFGAGIFAACLGLGLGAPLFYSGSVAVLTALALHCAWTLPTNPSATPVSARSDQKF